MVTYIGNIGAEFGGLLGVRKQLGWRLSGFVVERFVELCDRTQIRPSEAAEEFMRRVVEVGDVREALKMIEPAGEKMLMARELRARALMASVQGGLKSDIFDFDAQQDYLDLLGMLPGLRDAELIEEIRRLSANVDKALRRE